MYSTEQESSTWHGDSNHKLSTSQEYEMLQESQEPQELHRLDGFDSLILKDTINRPAEPSGTSSDGCFFTDIGGDWLADRQLLEGFPHPSEAMNYLTPVSGQHSSAGCYSGNVEPHSSQPATTPLLTIDGVDASWSNSSLDILTSASSNGDGDSRNEYPPSQMELNGIQCSDGDDSVRLPGFEDWPPDTAEHATGYNTGDMTECSMAGVQTGPSCSPGMGSSHYDHTQPMDQVNQMELGNNDPKFSDMPWGPLSLRGAQHSENIQPRLTYSAAASYELPEPMDHWNSYSAVSDVLQPGTLTTSFEPNSYSFSESMTTVRASLTSDNLTHVSQRTHRSSSNYSLVESHPRNACATLGPQRNHRHSKTSSVSSSHKLHLTIPTNDCPSSSASSPAASLLSVTPANELDVLLCLQDGCPKTFQGIYRRGTRQRHMRLKHGKVRGKEEKEYPCEACGCNKVYMRQDARLKHYRKRHPELKPSAAVRRK